MNSTPTRVDLATGSRNILAALVKLLAPHTPCSLQVLGSIFNAGPRSSKLLDVDPSKISLWSTIPLHDLDVISTVDAHTLFTVVTFSHVNHEFYFFCSAESRDSDLPPTGAEETHVRQVIRYVLDIVGDAYPKYHSILCFNSAPTWRVHTDPPMILIGAVHAKWTNVLAPMSTYQVPIVRYAWPPSALSSGDVVAHGPSSKTTTKSRMMIRAPKGVDVDQGTESQLEIAEIRHSDVPFVHAASSIPRSDAYILSRAPYSVCLREQRDLGNGHGGGRPVACALMHCDGSIGALRVDPRYRRQGLGVWTIRALVEKLDFGGDQSEQESITDGGQNLGGGALGWNWVDTDPQNEVANRLFATLVGKENMKINHWIFMHVQPRSG